MAVCFISSVDFSAAGLYLTFANINLKAINVHAEKVILKIKFVLVRELLRQQGKQKAFLAVVARNCKCHHYWK